MRISDWSSDVCSSDLADMRRSLSSISTSYADTKYQKELMHSGVSAVATAMDQAVRRLEAALEQREAAFRRLAEQHGAAGAELKTLREALQATKDEADPRRERAAVGEADGTRDG